MATDLTSALNAYRAAAGQAAQAAGGAQPADETAGQKFTELVQGALETTNTSLVQAEQLTASAAVGDAELVDVVTAVAAAEVQLETVIAVRDEVIRAYNDILKMPI
ncbi:flagellar hook-basal body complex protein FliE [Hyphobacterium sp. HN65]|uniref:Flagellar hook-basal body complex protein FliE n=1 Tax=Hyphobacterium lacteum TaxID=3116575 RepID=A0ABU7LQJ3_9PROT|nr:flagellar hook-basal body complex protein FliE [Hyphobacterium sp. HN65]MEE2526177.1 flagellar hook-basal body complex protein FliE [Hyphobacterium sp. HN65]